jgi:hypothetical protein
MTPGIRSAVYACVASNIKSNMELLDTISSHIQYRYDDLSIDTHSEYLSLEDIITRLSRVIDDLDINVSSEGL